MISCVISGDKVNLSVLLLFFVLGTQSTVTVVQQPAMITTVAMAPMYRESPVQTVCPHCRAQIVTATQYETGALAWLICAGLCVVGYVEHQFIKKYSWYVLIT